MGAHRTSQRAQSASSPRTNCKPCSRYRHSLTEPSASGLITIPRSTRSRPSLAEVTVSPEVCCKQSMPQALSRQIISSVHRTTFSTRGKDCSKRNQTGKIMFNRKSSEQPQSGNHNLFLLDSKHSDPRLFKFNKFICLACLFNKLSVYT